MTRVPAREQGFALITALWAAMVLAVVTGSIIALGNAARRTTHGDVAMAELDAAAEGAIAMVELELMALNAAIRMPVDGTPFDVACCGQTVRVSVQDASGLVDLNMASDAVLRQVFEVAGGLDAETARILVDRIMDWREPGAGKRLNGAKADDYRAAGYGYGPREGPFATVEELKLVMGMTPALFARVRPTLTVALQSTSLNPDVAPRAVLLLLPEATPDLVDALLLKRASRNGRDQPTGSGEVGPLAGHAVRITAAAHGSGQAVRTRDLDVRVTGLAASPFWTYRQTE